MPSRVCGIQRLMARKRSPSGKGASDATPMSISCNSVAYGNGGLYSRSQVLRRFRLPMEIRMLDARFFWT